MRLFGALLTLALFASPLFGADPALDVRHYDLDVQVLETSLKVRAALEVVANKPPKSWKLELADRMTLSFASIKGRSVPYSSEKSGVVLDLSSFRDLKGTAFRLELTLTGKPHTRFSERRGGFLRTSVGSDVTYIRSQYPWYPRAADDPATYKVSVETREGWVVRTAGDLKGKSTKGIRKTWVFELSQPVLRVGLIAGPYKVVSLKHAGEFVLDAFVLPGDETGARRLLDIAKRALSHYGKWWGDISAKRYTLVEMPKAFGEGSGYSEHGYLLIGKGAFVVGLDVKWANDLVAHEVAHSWFGGEVSFSNFISESLASYATLRFIEAERGEKAALMERRHSIDAVIRSAVSGQEVAFSEISGFGGGMDPEVYRVHAYEKGTMVLSMFEDAIGREKMDGLLRQFLEEHRGQLLDYRKVRAYLLKGGGAYGRPVITQWENPGIPSLRLDYRVGSKGRSWKAKGSVLQEGVKKPYKMNVLVRAICGDEKVEQVVKFSGSSKGGFNLTLQGKPYGVIVDPEYRLLVNRTEGASANPADEVSRLFEVVNNPKESSPRTLEQTIIALRHLLRRGAGEYEGLCHTGVGRLLFRQGKFDDARKDFREALRLGAGGPFHQRWVYLRLGCMADLEKDRKKALEHYGKVISYGKSDHTSQAAARFKEKPYRGYAKDG
ncbi:MAG: M1 family aminopeptidase [Planctomycetota bacterium]|jgi:tetratricopeptide (TPR) repeat protein